MFGSEKRLFTFILLGFAPVQAAGNFAITNPAAGSRLTGPIALAANNLDIGSAETIEFLLNDRLVAGPVRAPFQASWHSALVWDGPGVFKAIARDRNANIVNTTAGVPVTIANGITSVRVISPAPDSTVAGTIPVQLEISRPNGAAVPVDGVMFFVDGKKTDIAYFAGPAAPALATTSIVTSQFPNGPHTIFAGVHTTESGGPPVAMAQFTINFENGRTPSQLLPKWRDIVLLPGESDTLNPQILFTNGDVAAAGPVSYTSSDSSIAAVSPDGLVTAGRVGIATVTVFGQGLSSTVRVLVSGTRQFPHFAGDGALLTQYDPARSFFPKSVFYLEPKLMDASAALAAETRAASINALEAGFYLAKQDLNNPQSLADFRLSWDVHWGQLQTAARQQGFKLILNGDNLARFPSNLSDNLTWPWAPDAIKHVFTTMRDSKVAVALEMVDESSGMWGTTPFPTDGRWLKLNPPIPDDAFSRIMGWINSVAGRPPLSWPILWLTGPDVAANWMGDPRISDYASNYWDLNDWRHAYPWGMSLPQVYEGLDNVVVKRMPVLQRDRPALQLISINGPAYTKLGPGEQYTPGQDRQQGPAIRPEAIGAQVMYAAAVGQSGIRAYGYDYDGWKNDRKSSPAGTRDRQTGADPFTVGTDRWQAMSSAFRLLTALEPYLFYPQISAVNPGPSFVTGARAGAKGRMLIAINFLDQTVTARVDRSPYIYAGASTQLRYRLQGASLGSEKVPNESSSNETFLPGEAKVWIFEPAVTTTAVRIVRPLPGEVVSGTESVVAVSPDPISQSELWIDGKIVATQTGLAPFSWVVSGGAPDTWRSVVVRAYNAAGQLSEARVGVRNPADGVIAPPNANQPPQISLTSPVANATYSTPATIAIEASASDPDGTIAKVEFFQGTTLLGSATSAPYRLSWPNVPVGTYSMTARAIDSAGAVTVTPAIAITVSSPVVVAPGSFVRGINLGGAAVTIDGNTWLSHQAALTSGLLTLTNTSIWTTSAYAFPFSPPADAATSEVLKSVVWAPGTSPGTGFTVQTPVANGAYQIYLWFLENNTSNYRSMDVRLEGQTVQTAVGNLALGAWVKAGPYSANVADGSLTIDILNGGKGDPALYGLAVFTGTSGPDLPPPPPTNRPPQVTLTSPAGNIPYSAPAAIPIAASASDPDGQSIRVEFLQGSSILATRTAPPYTFDWTNVPAGTYTLTARATDSAGVATVSSPVSVTVSAPVSPNFVRGINLGGPAVVIEGNQWLGHTDAVSAGLLSTNGSTWSTARYGFPLSPAVDSSTLSMLRSAVRATNTSLGEGFRVDTPLSNQNYQVYLWILENNDSGPRLMDVRVEGVIAQRSVGSLNVGQWVKLGPYSAQVTDGILSVEMLDAGIGDPILFGLAIYRDSTSGPPANRPPVVTLNAPTGQPYVAPATVVLSATASDPDGTIAKVEFLKDSTVLSTLTGPPYAYNWLAVSAGTHRVYARATDALGAVTTSTAVDIVVTSPGPVTPPPTSNFVVGVNLGGEAVVQNGNQWLSMSAATSSGVFSTNGQVWSSTTPYDFALSPVPDTETRKILQSAVYKGSTSLGNGFDMRVTAAPGTYDLYFWVLENYTDRYRAIDIQIGGASVASRVGELAKGAWQRLGPFRATVPTGGTSLNIGVLNGGKGDPALFGLEVYRSN